MSRLFILRDEIVNGNEAFFFGDLLCLFGLFEDLFDFLDVVFLFVPEGVDILVFGDNNGNNYHLFFRGIYESHFSSVLINFL